MKENTSNRKLEVIPKMGKYIQYILEVIIKIPRTEKFSIGTEYKISMYETLRYVMYLNKIEDWINNYPRAMFNYKSTNEILSEMCA